MKLSHRLETIASFVPEGSNVADIGTDHGYIPIHLVESGTARRALAMDLRSGPLERAAAHIRSRGLETRIEIRLSDGLRGLKPGEADCVVIAGMGGELMIRILEEGRHMWDSVDYWVLSPQSGLCKVRKYLERQEFSIVRETMMVEEGKYYTVMGAVRGAMNWGRETYYRYGKYLIREKNPVLMEYLEREKRQLLSALAALAGKDTEAAGRGEAEVRRKLEWIREAQDEMQ